MTSRRWPYAAAVLLGCAWALLAHAPASWVASAVARASGRHVLLSNAQGSWHDGRALVVLSAGPQGRDASTLPGLLSWKLGFGRLWAGAVDLRLSWPPLAAQALRARLEPGFGGWSLEQQGGPWLAAFPASLLEGLGTPWNTLAPQGLVHLRLQQLRLRSAAGRLDLQGRLRADAMDMSSRLSTLSPLGSYRVEVDGRGGTAGVALSTLSGSLILAGDGVWNGQRMQFSGTARAAPGREQALATLLGLLGRREGDHVRIGL